MILDETGIRIGNQYYADKNGTYGLSTLRRKHLNIDDEILIFQYQGKSQQNREVTIEDDDLIRLIKKSAELPGYELFRYKLSNGTWNNIDSDEVNTYIHTKMGSDFSSKDFRTWTASRLAIEMYTKALELKQDAPRRKFSNILLRLVADELGNSPTVCRSYYIHPRIMELIEEQTLPICQDDHHDIYDHQLSCSEEVLMEII